MTDQTMIERVRMAICCPDGCAFATTPESGGCMAEAEDEKALRVLEEIREPTEAMMEAGEAVGTDHYGDHYNGPEWREHDPVDVWRAMIAAALEEAK